MPSGFHVHLFKSYYEDMEQLNRNISKRALIRVKMSYDQEVETIIADQVI